MSSGSGVFQFGYIPFLVFLKFFFHVIYPFGLTPTLSLFPYFTPELFSFLDIRLFVCSCTLFIDLFEEFSFNILEGTFLLVLLDPVPVPFESPSFRQYLWSYFFQSIALSDLSAVVFWLYSFTCILVYFPFLSSIACCHSFFMRPSFSISVWLIFRGIPISSLSN